MEQVAIADRKPEQQLSPSQVMNYLHGLQDRAGRDLSLSSTAGAHQQVFYWDLFQWLWHGKLEMPPKIFDCLLTDMIDKGKVIRLINLKFMVSDELPCLLNVLEIEPVPIQYRTTTQN